ncbi:MAG: CotH kinase family protein [Oscillospiraceae bacterium]|nr:CotH kinase family protein [Oscillospiraceae bacterium]
MSTHKAIDRLCAAALVLALLLTALLMNGEALGLQSADRAMGYETRLFDTGRVHTIDIVMDDWDSFIETCENEEYAVCDVVIDGEACRSVGIRAKGNTSLSSVSAMNSDRYSFKIEFDQYDSTFSYHGLDKLSLNNLIQDNTYMKDYLTYRMMGEFGVAAPLCSYVSVTVNGEPWGLYLAVEGVEDAFLQRNYGSDYGELYKPDSLSFGGGRGNGKGFDMEQFMSESEGEAQDGTASQSGGSGNMQRPAGMMGGNMQLPEDFDISSIMGNMGGMQRPESGDGSSRPDSQGGAMPGGMGGGMPGGMGGGDVKLQYSGDDPDSYSNIFSSAKTDVTSADQTRLIGTLQQLAGENAAQAVDVEQVLRYFVVHNYVVNADSYTGSMVHNYYLYEEDGRLSMIPWDYNLAFGTFMGGSASSSVNDPIDSPLSVSGSGDRPMMDWILASEEYTDLYHQYFAQFLETVDVQAMIEETAALIASYVENDATAFCTYEEFVEGVAVLKEFCALRSESVSGQLAGTIPTTDAGQSADSTALVDTGDLNLSAMGTMGGGMGGGMQRPGSSDREDTGETDEGQTDDTQTVPGGMQGFDPSQMPGGMQGFDPSQMPGSMQGFDPSQMPGGMQGFDPSQMPGGMGGGFFG